MTPGEIAERWGSEVTQVRSCPVVRKKFPSARWVSGQLVLNKIPQRSPSERSSLWQKAKERKEGTDSGRRYREIYEEFYRDTIQEGEHVHHQDHVRDNDHPLNLEKVTTQDHTRLHVSLRGEHNGTSKPERIPIFEVYMRMAEGVALRSHHSSVKVGCVVTSFDLRRVLSIGFNGNASGLANSVDCDIPGESQTIHAEENALIYAGEHGTDRIMFVTESPCLGCSKLLVNAGIKYLYYRKKYREPHPLKVVRYLGVMTCEYGRWAKETWKG